MRKFFSYYKPYRRLLWIDLSCAVLLSMMTLAFPLCVRYITKLLATGITPNTLRQIYLMGGVMVVLVLVRTFSDMLVGYQGHVMGTLMERDMRNELFDHYQKLSFGFYDDQKTGQLMTRLTNDSFNMAELYHHGPEDVVISTLHFVGAFIILSMINWPLALIVFLVLPFMAVHAVYFNRQMKRTLRRSRDRIGDINAQVEDSLAGIRVVQSFTNETVEQAKFAHTNEEFVASRRADIRSEVLFYEGLVGLTQLMTIVVVVFGGVTILRGTLDLPDLLTFLLYVGILIEPIKRFGNFTRLYQEGISGFERFMEVLEVEPAIQDAPNASDLCQVQGAVTFANVRFQYNSSHDTVFHNLSLSIQAGEYVALVGMSGVGKSTLCALIPRFYEVSAGTILLDGRPLQEIQLAALRRHIGIVHQDIYLFVGTIAENIRYGKPTATIDEIVAAAKEANAHDFIMALPHGYDTDIGERGVKLSGGQKQRISIARVFLKNPPILIFDEATSSLDNESEKAVQSSLERLAHNRTTIVIAHRLSTVRNAQRIIVLANGTIAEEGTHEELVNAGGVYANLYNAQLRI
ncbi:MAG TPA: ABC transporter ATP-binding protein [Caldilineaceae bacterium]|nr:ABC transporter ATP-binding protein [Caldilineaceae bacterium]